ncbi:MAG: DUF192 domain-containing protein [Nanoarchaeota archaeon]
MRVSFLIVFSLCIFLTGCVQDRVTFFVPDGYVNIDVRVADTLSEQASGLMESSLKDGEGMLFVFPDTAQRAFWMKNVTIPLDIIFVDETKTVNEIKENLPPCERDPCAVYPSLKPARYVVEVPAGFAREHKIIVGSRMTSTVV